jgi:tetrahydromethanopterin S-methyltransferase subunit E
MNEQQETRKKFEDIVNTAFDADGKTDTVLGAKEIMQITLPDGSVGYRYVDPAPARTDPAPTIDRKVSARLINAALTSFIAASITICLHFALPSIMALSALVANLAHALFNLALCAAAVAVGWMLITMMGALTGGSGRNRTQKINLRVKGRRNKITIRQ